MIDGSRTFIDSMPRTPATGRTPASAPSAVPAAKVLRQFRVVFNSVKNHFRAVERQTGVSGAQIWAMSVINASPGIEVGELARAMDVHQSTASNLVRGLIGAGLAASSREGEDRRAVQLYLTVKGQKVLVKAPAPFAGILPDVLARLDRATLDGLDRDLAKLVRKLGQGSREGSVPLGGDRS